MGKVELEAREWLEDGANWIARPDIWDPDLTSDKDLVERLFEAGAAFVNIGLTDGIPTRADTLYVTLPHHERPKFNVMLELIKIKGDIIRHDRLKKDTDVIIISWSDVVSVLGGTPVIIRKPRGTQWR